MDQLSWLVLCKCGWGSLIELGAVSVTVMMVRSRFFELRNRMHRAWCPSISPNLRRRIHELNIHELAARRAYRDS